MGLEFKPRLCDSKGLALPSILCCQVRDQVLHWTILGSACPSSASPFMGASVELCIQPVLMVTGCFLGGFCLNLAPSPGSQNSLTQWPHLLFQLYFCLKSQLNFLLQILAIKESPEHTWRDNHIWGHIQPDLGCWPPSKHREESLPHNGTWDGRKNRCPSSALH